MAEQGRHRRLWDAFCTTPPEHTKPYRGSGGFQGTEYKPVHMWERLTEVFGPVGTGWGWDLLSQEMEDGAGYVIEDRLQFERIHTVLVRCWYWDAVELKRVELPPQFGCTAAVVYRKARDNRDAPRMESIVDARKMSITDAVSKGFQALGMVADILKGEMDGGARGSTTTSSKRTDPPKGSPKGTSGGGSFAERAKAFSREVYQVREEEGPQRAWERISEKVVKLRDAKKWDGLKRITDAQVNRLVVIAKKRTVSEDELHKDLAGELRIERVHDIPMLIYPAICVMYGADPEK